MNKNEKPRELLIPEDEWNQFHASLERLMSLYRKTLQKMKELNQRNEELTRELRDVTGLPTFPSSLKSVMEVPDESKQGPSEKRPEAEQILKTKPGLLEFFRIRLSRRSQNFAGTYASCRRCGLLIRRASRFCVGCGVDFGAFVCSCGRTLSPNDKFCDRCGRITGVH